jgi:hypothetical protein
VIKIGTVAEKAGVRVRISPGETNADIVIGAVKINEPLEIVEKREVGGNTWVRLNSLRPEWSCAIYQKREFIRLDDVVAHGRIACIRAIQCEVHHDETFP